MYCCNANCSYRAISYDLISYNFYGDDHLTTYFCIVTINSAVTSRWCAGKWWIDKAPSTLPSQQLKTVNSVEAHCVGALANLKLDEHFKVVTKLFCGLLQKKRCTWMSRRLWVQMLCLISIPVNIAMFFIYYLKLWVLWDQIHLTHFCQPKGCPWDLLSTQSSSLLQWGT